MTAISKKNNMLQLMQNQFLSDFSPSTFSSAITEVIVLTGTGFFLGLWFLPEAALFATPGFSWLMVGPLLTSLRYGFFYASISVILSLVALLIAQAYQLPWASGSIASLCLLLLWIGFVVGGFRIHWQRQINKLTASSEYLDKQLKEITTAHSLTKISHDRLQELVVSQISLRDTILEVRRQLLSTDVNIKNGDLTGIGSIILRVLSDYGDIQLASFHQVIKNKKINPKAIDSMGNHKILINPNDPLLLEAIETKKTVSLKQQRLNNKETGSLILAVPISDSIGRIWGIVAVNQMPFRSYRPDNLQLIATLAGYIGDLIGRKVDTSASAITDTELHSFLLQVQRCILDISSYEIPSVILGFEFINKQNYKATSTLLIERKRGLDQSWSVINRRNNQVICLLLPLTSELDLETYKSHILKLLQEHYSFPSFQAAGISFYQKMLSPKQSAADVIDGIANKLNIDLEWKTNSAERGIYDLD